jgi:MiaB-like tRNA modifying enzyme
MRVHIITYGCSNNQAESQIMAGLLLKNGATLVDDIDEADAIVLNTCSVKSATEQKILHNISSIHEENPGKRIVIAGCMPEAEYEKVREVAPFASMLSTQHIDKINVAVKSRVEFIGKSKIEKIALPKLRDEYHNIIPISSGCLSACTFCSTKIAKGALISYDPVKITGEIVGSDSKEFWLTSQDCGCYGFDMGTSLPQLMNMIMSQVRGQYFLRIGMMNPQHVKKILPELIEAYKNNHVFKFLHIPVQSGSDGILEKMKRGHRAEDFVHIIEEFRKEIPDITIWTDMIVGFPEESESDFELSMELLERVQPDFTNVSAYSVRPHTKAAKMGQLTSDVKKDRTRRMSELARKLCSERNERWIGWQGPVIVDEYNPQKGNFIGRNFAYKPVVLKGEHMPGDVIEVKISNSSVNCLFTI